MHFTATGRMVAFMYHKRDRKVVILSSPEGTNLVVDYFGFEKAQELCTFEIRKRTFGTQYYFIVTMGFRS